VVFVDLNLHLDQGFDVSEIGSLCLIAQSDRNALTPRPRGAPDAVHVCFGLVGKVEVEDVAHVIYVNASRRDVGGDEDRDLSALEARESPRSRVLALVSVNCGGGDPFSIKLLHESVGPVLCPSEDDRASHVPIADQPGKQCPFIGPLAEHHALLDRFNRG